MKIKNFLITLCISAILAGGFYCTNNIYAAEEETTIQEYDEAYVYLMTERFHQLFDNATIDGKDFVFHSYYFAEYQLKAPNVREYISSHFMSEYEIENLYDFTWTSSNTDAAIFSHCRADEETEYINYHYSEYEQIAIFKLGYGTTTISCTITDPFGNSKTITKDLFVAKEDSVNSVKFGNQIFKNHTTYRVKKTNYKDAPAETLSIIPSEGWEIKGITYTIRSIKEFAIDIKFVNNSKIKKMGNYSFVVHLYNKKYGKDDYYYFDIRDNSYYKFKLPNSIKKARFAVRRITCIHVPQRIYVLSYKKKAKKNDYLHFKSKMDLLRKLRYYFSNSYLKMDNNEKNLYYKYYGIKIFPSINSKEKQTIGDAIIYFKDKEAFFKFKKKNRKRLAN